METAFLIVVTLGALYFLYVKLVKNRGCDGDCNCGKK
ncbi:MAG: FeoB-associated Cys-rich membrane protein [Sulfurovum sp.]|nr:FeoB-associated Cys-rich membrane protein [Sulfurovum sp.]